MKAALVIFGILSALVVGIALLFTLGEIPALIGFLVVLGAAIYGVFAARAIARTLLTLVVLLLFAAGAYVGWGVFTLVQAFTDTSGPVAAPDAGDLASATAKIDAIEDSAAFLLELDEAEMTAYLLDALADNEDNPLESVTLDVIDRDGQPGLVEFTVTFKGGGIDGEGAVSAELDAGEIQITLDSLDVGRFAVPGLAEGAIEDLIESIGDLNDTLAEAGADIQSIEIGDDKVVVAGTQTSTDLITSDRLLQGLADNAAAISAAVSAPTERLGPGVVNSTSAGSAPFYVALGDSLAANVGVTEASDGYPSRLHNQLQMRDGATYGLRNFGISGETTGTMIRAGQLDEAVAFMEGTDVAYVTIDIGANNLLGHLGSEACSQSLETPGCRSRIDAAIDSYDDDLVVIFDAIQEAAPNATVVFMQAYNPFSLGFAGAIALEAETDRILQDFNGIAAAIAGGRGIVVADAFTPMQGTTAATTHMLDPEPDIHPLPIGFDILAAAILDSLG